MKRTVSTLLLACLLLMISCEKIENSDVSLVESTGDAKFEMTFYDAFDTVTKIILYAESQEEAEKYGKLAHERFLELHKYYDKYNRYSDIVNIRTINDKAGEEPVKISKDLMNLLEFSIDKYKKFGVTNIAIGSVTEIWSEYRDGHEEGAEYLDESPVNNEAKLPPMEELEEANKHTNIEDIILDKKNSQIQFKDPDLKIDVGAVAKGYATEIIAKELEREGLKAGLISAGGNVKIIGEPPETDRDYFGIGIQNPEAIFPVGGSEESMKDVIYENNISVVTSGDYQRYYIVDGKPYHHLIDPKTLMPADYFRSVTIMAEDSGYCDFLSTTIFCMPYEEGKKLVDSIDGVEAYWIRKDGSVVFTDGLKDKLRSQGATNRE